MRRAKNENLAAVLNIVHVKVFGNKGRYNYPFKVKRYLVYDPSKVTPWDFEKKTKAWLEE